MSTDRPAGGHPGAEDMAAYIDERATEADRARIEAHAADCPECRREIAEVTEVLSLTRSARRWRVWVPTAAVAAAVIAFLIFGPLAVETRPDPALRFRGTDSRAFVEGPSRIHVVSPAEAGVLDAGSLSFRWRSAGQGASYRLTLTNGEGGVVWTLATTDTVARLPAGIVLEPASTYHWYVDALLEDGWHATTGVHSFMTGR